MKKSKIIATLIPISIITPILTSISSCSNQQNHVWLVDTDEPTKEANENLQAKYFFGLDNNYQTKDIQISISTENKNDFIVSHFVSNNILVVTITFKKEVQEKTAIEFGLEFKTSTWKQTISNLKIIIKTFDPVDLANIKKANAILAKTNCPNMYEALQAVKSTVDIEAAIPEIGTEYVWDQKANRFIVISSLTGSVIYAPEDYVQNQNTWQLWKMIELDEFDEYNPYSQYLRKQTTNELSKTTFSFVSGFDCGENTDVKNVHYFYEKTDTQSAKDIIIRTCSYNTSVDVSAWNNQNGDVITHYGTMGDLTVVSNNKYIEEGKAISCSVYDGEIQIDASANIELTHVKAEVTLTDFKQSGSLIDKIYVLPEYVAEIQTEYPDAIKATDDEYQKEKTKYYESEHPDVEQSYVFDIYKDGVATNLHFNSLTEIQEFSNDVSNENPNEGPDRFFDGYTIILNKDYDMCIEGYNSNGEFTWKPICATTATGKKKYEYSQTAITNGFAGVFDGNNHSIINMNFGSETDALTDETALFGGVNGTIKNLNIMDSSVNVKCSDWTSEEAIRQASGGLLAMALGTKTQDTGVVTIENVHIYNSKLNVQYKSGLFSPYVQYCNELVVKDCSADSDTVLNSTYDETTTKSGDTGGGHGWFGHFAYYCKKVTLTNCTNCASINAINAAGGFIGLYGSNAYGLTLDNCKNYGNITITSYPKLYGPIAGGLIGCIQLTSTDVITTIKINNCVNEGTIDAPCTPTDTGHQWRIGGLVGYVDDTAIAGSTLEFENCINNGQIGSETTITKAPAQAMGGGFMGSCLTTSGKLVTTFKSCTQAGYLCGITVGHFIRELKTGSYSCENCAITGTIRDGATRITIDGEPA